MHGQTTEDLVAAQHGKFVVDLPALLAGPLRGRWVAWLDGVRGDFPAETDAYRWALATLGLDSGFVIARVEPEAPPVALSPFGIAR